MTIAEQMESKLKLDVHLEDDSILRVQGTKLTVLSEQSETD